MAKEFIIYADESTNKGEFYSNFYGGALIQSSNLDDTVNLLNNKKASENLFGEIKWSKVTDNYLKKYISIMNTFFDLVDERIIRIRIMFTKNVFVPKSLTPFAFSRKKSRKYIPMRFNGTFLLTTY